MHSVNGADSYSDNIQLISGEQEFTHGLFPGESLTLSDELPRYMAKVGLDHAGFNYNLIAVFGSQSTGKSTLLNKLFGTKFETMDEAARKQTTKVRGIWMSRGVNSNILIMDVEGTDGRERGDNQDFERKSALFSLATSEVIIVNLWEHQVGLYQGANMGLLKTVFEVNLQLFQKNSTKERSLLIFVIRDHVGTTPLSNLQTLIQADLTKIWSTLSKPAGLENCQIEEYFDFQFTALSHKILMPDKFDAEIAVLQKRFAEKSHKDYVFNPVYHKRIPADGLSVYASGIWTQIMSNKDLDLPTQQELLAQYRCDEISALAVEEFNRIIKVVEANSNAGRVIPDLGNFMTEAREAALKIFDTEASRYHNQVYQRKREDLRNKTDSRLHVLFVAQLSALHKSTITEFQSSIQSKLSSGSYDFANLLSTALLIAETRFIEQANKCNVEGAGWAFDVELDLLKTELEELGTKLRQEEVDRALNRTEKQIRNAIDEPISMVFKKPDLEMWDRVLSLFNDILDIEVERFLNHSKGFNATDEENESSVEELKRKAWLALRAKIDEEVSESNMLLKLRENFEDKFRYDSEGVPRVWKPSDDIDGYYRAARDEALKLIPLFSLFKLRDGSEPDIPIPQTETLSHSKLIQVLSASKQHDLSTRFKKSADALYVEAKRSTISNVSQVPLWIYGVMLALGWNELIALLRNPLYFLFIGLLGVGAYIIIQMNLVGPLERIIRAMMQQSIEILREKVREWVGPVDGPIKVAWELEEVDRRGRENQKKE
ncbi:Protein SEY1 [Neolecta irregularis DAH-3]|uniref:Protein SEY1 n=1 Tax=Neolecta irregularis (strain DAH-3) TaxID=1198029 RepID=A0A1U7LLY7_NEOID|nr:Protein SEY1 [Neolecta irregularis DAH-3]|eukprot:OLL23674.1 Protein SEY1 [Neolecta irregularis DAH-3]